jgi:glucose-6-phosphate 1-dehydrogenase
MLLCSFGADLQSSEDLAEKISSMMTEEHVYRIDHL